jgi:hypothetical protein
MPDDHETGRPPATSKPDSEKIAQPPLANETADRSTFVRDLLAALGLLTASGLTILKTIFELETGTVVVLVVIGAVAAVIVVLAPHITTRGRAIVAVAGVALVLGVEIAAGALLRPDPFAADRITGFLQACHRAPLGCEITKQISVATSAGDMRVFAVTSYRRLVNARVAAQSGLVITDTDGTLKWQRTFSAGYGVVGLDTDSTGHIFARFAHTNHSGVVWVLDVRPDNVEDFGTVGGARLKAGNYSEPADNGERYLFTYRRGWPADMKPGALRDVYAWDGSTYTFRGCERSRSSRPFSGRFYASYRGRRCQRPVGRYEYENPSSTG